MKRQNGRSLLNKVCDKIFPLRIGEKVRIVKARGIYSHHNGRKGEIYEIDNFNPPEHFAPPEYLIYFDDNIARWFKRFEIERL